MRINLLIINIIVFLVTGLLHSQDVKDDVLKTNLDIYTGLMNKSLDFMENQFVLSGKDKIYSISINGKRQYSEFLYTVLKQKFYNIKVVSEVDSISSDYRILFENISFITKYNKISGSILKNKRVERQIEISYKSSIKSRSKDSLIFYKNVFDISKDEFYFEKLDNVERGEYNFLKGTLPNQSFFEKALIPGIVVLASAITIISFFAIRSK